MKLAFRALPDRIYAESPFKVAVRATLDDKPVAVSAVTYAVAGPDGFSQRRQYQGQDAELVLSRPGAYTLLAYANHDSLHAESAPARLQILEKPTPPPSPEPDPPVSELTRGPRLPFVDGLHPPPAHVVVLLLLAGLAVASLVTYRERCGHWPWQRPALEPNLRSALEFKVSPRVRLRLTFRAVHDRGRQTVLPPSTPTAKPPPGGAPWAP